MKDAISDSGVHRVLHIGKYFPPHKGGMETILRDQMNIQTRDQGLEVAAVVHSSEKRLTDLVEVTALGYTVRRAARWFTAAYAPISPLFLLSVLREMRRLDPTQITIHMPNASAFWLLLLPNASHRDWLVLWHSDVLPSKHSIALRIFYYLYKPLETMLLKRANTIVATSPSYLQTSNPLRPYLKKSNVEPLKLDSKRIPSPYLEAKPPPKKSDEGLRVLCVGRLTYYKDFRTAIRAVAEISGAQLRIVGEGQQRPKLEEMIAELGISKRVKLLGEVTDEEVWQQFIWCDVHVLPSIERTEAFGVVILEAFIFGKKSVVSDVKGSGMEYASRLCGGYQSFKAGDYRSLKQVLEQLPR